MKIKINYNMIGHNGIEKYLLCNNRKLKYDDNFNYKNYLLKTVYGKNDKRLTHIEELLLFYPESLYAYMIKFNHKIPYSSFYKMENEILKNKYYGYNYLFTKSSKKEDLDNLYLRYSETIKDNEEYCFRLLNLWLRDYYFASSEIEMKEEIKIPDFLFDSVKNNMCNSKKIIYLRLNSNIYKYKKIKEIVLNYVDKFNEKAVYDNVIFYFLRREVALDKDLLEYIGKSKYICGKIINKFNVKIKKNVKLINDDILDNIINDISYNTNKVKILNIIEKQNDGTYNYDDIKFFLKTILNGYYFNEN